VRGWGQVLLSLDSKMGYFPALRSQSPSIIDQGVAVRNRFWAGSFFAAAMVLFAVHPASAQSVPCVKDGDTVTVTGTVLSTTLVQPPAPQPPYYEIRASFPALSCGGDVVVQVYELSDGSSEGCKTGSAIEATGNTWLEDGATEWHFNPGGMQFAVDYGDHVSCH